MKKIHGITATSEGTYVRVTAVKLSEWKIIRKDKWQIGNILRNSLLMNCQVKLGIECHWIRQLPAESELLVTSSESSFLSPCVHESHRALHCQMLEKNLNAIYPDDAYLSTVPLYLTKEPKDSFIAVYKDENILRIGITIDRKLSAVFSLPSLMFAQLNGFLERIRRFWNRISSDIQFPSLVYIFNKQDISPGLPFNSININLPVNDSAEIKALGVALCSLAPVVPALCGATEASKNVGIRTAVYNFSMGILVISALLSGYVYYQDFINQRQLKKCESDYKNILNNNNEIRELTKSGESLANKLLRIEKFAASPTKWSKFLELIGNNRPSKLYFDRLGSDSKQIDSQTIKIALSGWADSETTITDLIQKMNSSSMVSNVTLSSLERDKKLNNTRFKILCNVQLSGN